MDNGFVVVGGLKRFVADDGVVTWLALDGMVGVGFTLVGGPCVVVGSGSVLAGG